MRVLARFVVCLLLTFPVQAEERILAVSPHACETLFAIGAGKQVVGAGAYCDYPQAAKSLPRIGDYMHINVEAALRLKPTLAVVYNKRLTGLRQLERAGVKIVHAHPHSVEEVITDMLRLGRLTGHVEESRVLSAAFRRRLHSARCLPNRPLTVFYETWHKPLISEGGKSFVTDVLRYAGGANVFGHVDLESPRVSVESVIRAKPDIILVAGTPGHVKARSSFWQRYFGGRIPVIGVPHNLISRPGPRLIDGIEAIAARFCRFSSDS